MSIDSDVGDAVGGAALGGLALGLAWQVSNGGSKWHKYAVHMEKKVAALQEDLERAQFGRDTRDQLLGVSDEKINHLNASLAQSAAALNKVNEKNQKISLTLTQKSAELAQMELELEKIRKINETTLKKVDTLQQLLDLMVDQCGKLECALTAQAAHTFVINKLYSRLVDEIGQVSNLKNLEALSPKYLLSVVTEDWESYCEKGRAKIYKPSIFGLTGSQETIAFGGSDAPSEVDDTTTVLLRASTKRP